jgi:hypothetical protein
MIKCLAQSNKSRTGAGSYWVALSRAQKAFELAGATADGQEVARAASTARSSRPIRPALVEHTRQPAINGSAEQMFGAKQQIPPAEQSD